VRLILWNTLSFNVLLLMCVGCCVWCQVFPTVLLLWCHDLPGIKELQEGFVFLWNCKLCQYTCNFSYCNVCLFSVTFLLLKMWFNCHNCAKKSYAIGLMLFCWFTYFIFFLKSVPVEHFISTLLPLFHIIFLSDLVIDFNS